MISLPMGRMAQMVKRFEMLEAQMAEGVDPEAYGKLASEYASMEPLVQAVRAYQSLESEIEDLQSMLDDEEMGELAKAELPELQEKKTVMEAELQILL